MHADPLATYLPFCWRYLLIQCREKSRKTSEQSLLNYSGGMMDFQVKVFNWQDQAKHVVLMAGGVMGKNGYKKNLFCPRRSRNGHARDLAPDTERVASHFVQEHLRGKQHRNGLRLCSRASTTGQVLPSIKQIRAATGIADFHRLQFLRTDIVNRGLSAAVFHDPKIAVDWLAERQYSPGLSR